MGTTLPGLPILPAPSELLPLGASLAFLGAVGTAVVSRRLARRNRRTLASVRRDIVPEAVASAAPLPLLVGTYRKRSVQLTLQETGSLFVSVALARYGELEVVSHPDVTLPWGEGVQGRLRRLPAPWSVTVRGRQLWLSVPGEGRDPLTMRRRLELACDLADEWDAVI